MGNKVLDSFAGFFGDIGRARAAANTYNDLSLLSDAGLKARGLTRSELPAYAFNTAFKTR